MRKIRTGDEVIVIAGRDRGSRGAVRRVIAGARGKPARLVVEGVGGLKKHRRPNPQKNDPGGIVTIEAPIAVSNVALFNPARGRGDRVRIGADDKGAKRRVFASDGKTV